MATKAESQDVTSTESDGCAACCQVEPKIDKVAIEKALKEQETKLREEFKFQIEQEIEYMKDRFDFILQNEQVRASHMLREAHRERSEKINALKTQLECKNLAGLMYVLCLERRKSRLERMRIIEEYTGYIRALQDILCEGQDLILHLSRGYKTAARVDYEWRQRMLKIIYQFQNFICNFTGGSKEDIQYFFDLPKLCKISSPIKDDENEDPCEKYEDDNFQEYEEEKSWWEKLEDEKNCKRPFVMFGDMSEFKPPQRRAVLKTVKAAKTAPKRWKEYVFNEMFLQRDCKNTNEIKHEFNKHLPCQPKWECEEVQTMDGISGLNYSGATSRRVTTTSVDMRGRMGSILKLITTSAYPKGDRFDINKSTLLAARDSKEIASATRLLDKHKGSNVSDKDLQQDARSVGHKSVVSTEVPTNEKMQKSKLRKPSVSVKSKPKDMESPEPHLDTTEEFDDTKSTLGNCIHDSVQLLQDKVKDQYDFKINTEKVCPMEECQRMQMDSFLRKLPPYMRASPFLHFEQTFDEYEPCSPEQLEILKQRIEDKGKDHHEAEVDPLDEWVSPVEGVAVQTSLDSILPPCTCQLSAPESRDSSQIMIYKLQDLFPVKETLDLVRKECFFDDTIQLDRFKVVGQEEPSRENMRKDMNAYQEKGDFQSRLYEVRKVLNQHPSLCSLFQANTS